MKKSWKIKNLDDLDSYAKQMVDFLTDIVSKKIDHATVVTLTGDLGAGKTTLTQRIAKHLGIGDEVSSPTFVIAKYYDLPKVGSPTSNFNRLIHVDAYRLDGEPLEPLGFEQLFADPNNLVIIEWPEYIQSVLPAHRTDISISINENEARNIEIS